MKKSYGLYVGKYRPKKYGYGEFFTGKVDNNRSANNLIQTRSATGDRVLLKDGLKVVKVGKVVDSGLRDYKGRRIKYIQWN